MIIKDLSISEPAGLYRISARVEWEDVRRDAIDLFIDVPAENGEELFASADGMLTAAFVPAWNAGERRIRVDTLCGTLRDRLQAVARILRHWFPEMGNPPVVEAASETTHEPVPRSACSLLSGGVDSICTLWRHSPQREPTPSRRISAALAVHFQPDPLQPERGPLPIFDNAHALCDDIGVRCVPVVTNLDQLERDGNVYAFKWHGAALTSIAHHFSNQFSLAYLASSYEYDTLVPWGSHPLLDANYGTARLQIEHDGAFLTRFEKTAMIAHWPKALAHMLVCQKSKHNNCGRCEKCLHTQTALVALGKLRDATSFADDDLSSEVLATVADYQMLSYDSQVLHYMEMVPALAEVGRHDLLGAIDYIRDEFYGRRARVDVMNVIAALRDCATPFVVADNDFFGTPVVDSKGRYWGQPSGGDHAARQLDVLKKAGYKILLMRSDSWWLDYFVPLRSCLEEIDSEQARANGFRMFSL